MREDYQSQDDQREAKRVIWICDIPKHATEADITDCISRFGRIRKLHIQYRAKKVFTFL